jgi:hypothetical protein
MISIFRIGFVDCVIVEKKRDLARHDAFHLCASTFHRSRRVVVEATASSLDVLGTELPMRPGMIFEM